MNSKKQKGVSLVELMIGLTVGLIVLAAATTFAVNNLKANRDAVNAARLNQDLRAIMDLMVRDIRRAHYTASIQSSLGANTSTLLPNALTLGGTCTTSGCDKITYTYESIQREFDLSSGSLRHKIGSAAAEKVSDDYSTSITNLNFCYVDTQGDSDPTNDTCTSTAPSSHSITISGVSEKIKINMVKISITGALIKSPATTKTLIETVKIRNDSFS
ncbi:PilW family protein [Macromonas nakdongensis]|uniref:PilW family protein n=1 Tax=Macromonas nakdongensis TaxID=1843082 RepID=UPI000C34151E|nr:prepilin-type N-terminal cleavage/methylation domain-containing protein [Macromonas nakdongensis]